MERHVQRKLNMPLFVTICRTFFTFFFMFLKKYNICTLLYIDFSSNCFILDKNRGWDSTDCFIIFEEDVQSPFFIVSID